MNGTLFDPLYIYIYITCGSVLFVYYYQIQLELSGLSKLRLEACATIARSTELQIGITSDSLWILNRGTVGVDLAAGELFGFNVGTYQEVPSGAKAKHG